MRKLTTLTILALPLYLCGCLQATVTTAAGDRVTITAILQDAQVSRGVLKLGDASVDLSGSASQDRANEVLQALILRIPIVSP
jgi:hypothetical protein